MVGKKRINSKRTTRGNVSKFRRKYFFLFGILLIFILLLLGGNYYLGTIKGNPQPIPTPVALVTDEPTPSTPPRPTRSPITVSPLGQIPPTSAETLHTWKKYTNTKYGYSILYPPDWTIYSFTNDGPLEQTASLQIDSPGDQAGSGTFVPLHINVTPTSKTNVIHSYSLGLNTPQVKTLLQEKPGSIIYEGPFTILHKTDNLTISGVVAYGLFLDISMGGFRDVLIEHNNNFYEVSNSSADLQTYLQLLSTFTFTN